MIWLTPNVLETDQIELAMQFTPLQLNFRALL
jgi:hypothetical protein